MVKDLDLMMTIFFLGCRVYGFCNFVILDIGYVKLYVDRHVQQNSSCKFQFAINFSSLI